MALDNKENLIKYVIGQLHRDDLDLQMDDFILITETEMRANQFANLKLSKGEVISDALTSTTSRYLGLPTGFNSSRSFTITIDGQICPLKYRTPGTLVVKNYTGIPTYFSISGDQIELDILPDQEYTITTVYHQRLTPLVNPEDTNIVLEKYPNIYLFGLLRQGFIYAQDSEQESKYSTLFFNAIDSANRAEKEIMYGPSLQMTAQWSP